MRVPKFFNFENTEIAFSHLSNRELQNAYQIFKGMSYAPLVNFGSKVILIALKIHLPIKSILKNTAYKHFCGGETIPEVKSVVSKLDKYGINVILNFGVEGKHSEEEFDKTAKSLHKTLKYAIHNESINTISCKPSGLIEHYLLEKLTSGKKLDKQEQIRFEKGKSRLWNLVKAASENKVHLHLDAEETWIQDAIDDLVFELSIEFNKDFPTVINGIQLYIKSKLMFLKTTLIHARENNYIPGVKLVRGAYLEKERTRSLEMGYPNPICNTVEETHENYNSGLKYCIENIDMFHLTNATHNEYSCEYLAILMKENNIEKNNNRIVSAQLKGMSDNITFSLASAGYNVQKYIPYGPVKQVIPYLIRRAQENTSVEGQTSRELELIKKERQRRKGKV